MWDSLELSHIHQFPPTVEPNRDGLLGFLLAEQHLSLFPPFLHDGRPSYADFGHTLPSCRPGSLPHQCEVHHLQILVIWPGGVLAAMGPAVVEVEWFAVIDVVELPLPVTQLLHVICVAAEGEDPAMREVVLADVKVDLIVGKENGDLGIGVLGLVEDTIQGLFDKLVVAVPLFGSDVFPERGFPGWGGGVERRDVIVSGVVVEEEGWVMIGDVGPLVNVVRHRRRIDGNLTGGALEGFGQASELSTN